MPDFGSKLVYNCEQYLYGLPLAGARRLYADELGRLKGLARRRLFVLVFWLLVGPGAFLAGLAAYAYNTRYGLQAVSVADNLVLLKVLFVVMLVASLFAFKARGKWAVCSRTAAAAALRVFKGMADRELSDDIREGGFTSRANRVTPGEDVTVELFKGSGVVYSVNGNRARRWGELQVTSAAKVSVHPEYEKVWSEESGCNVYLRKMLAGELKELKRYTRLSGIWPHVLMALTLTSIIAGLAHAVVGETTAGILFLAISAIAVAAVIVRAYRDTASLRKDYRRGVILGYTKEQLLKDEPDFPLRNVGLLNEEIIETLPKSRAVWREGVMPAQWRDGCK